MIFPVWLHIHYSLRVTRMMQCFYDFNQPLKTLCSCGYLTQVRKLVTPTVQTNFQKLFVNSTKQAFNNMWNISLSLSESLIITCTHCNFGWHQFRFHYALQLAGPSGGANAVLPTCTHCEREKSMMNGLFVCNYIKPTLANTVRTPNLSTHAPATYLNDHLFMVTFIVNMFNISLFTFSLLIKCVGLSPLVLWLFSFFIFHLPIFLLLKTLFHVLFHSLLLSSSAT